MRRGVIVGVIAGAIWGVTATILVGITLTLAAGVDARPSGTAGLLAGAIGAAVVMSRPPAARTRGLVGQETEDLALQDVATRNGQV